MSFLCVCMWYGAVSVVCVYVVSVCMWYVYVQEHTNKL